MTRAFLSFRQSTNEFREFVDDRLYIYATFTLKEVNLEWLFFRG